MAQRVKDLASLQQLGLPLWHGFSPWPGNVHGLRVLPKKFCLGGGEMWAPKQPEPSPAHRPAVHAALLPRLARRRREALATLTLLAAGCSWLPRFARRARATGCAHCSGHRASPWAVLPAQCSLPRRFILWLCGRVAGRAGLQAAFRLAAGSLGPRDRARPLPEPPSQVGAQGSRLWLGRRVQCPGGCWHGTGRSKL